MNKLICKNELIINYVLPHKITGFWWYLVRPPTQSLILAVRKPLCLGSPRLETSKWSTYLRSSAPTLTSQTPRGLHPWWPRRPKETPWSSNNFYMAVSLFNHPRFFDTIFQYRTFILNVFNNDSDLDAWGACWPNDHSRPSAYAYYTKQIRYATKLKAI